MEIQMSKYGNISTGNGHVVSGSVHPTTELHGTIQNAISLNSTLHNSIYRGMSAYEIAVKLGFVGTEEEWLKSLAVAIEEVVNTDDEYILKFISYGSEIITPNLIARIQPITPIDIDRLIKEVSEDE